MHLHEFALVLSAYLDSGIEILGRRRKDSSSEYRE
jgi:hypothetical protein